jgi:hypothetical protein
LNLAKRLPAPWSARYILMHRPLDVRHQRSAARTRSNLNS